MMINQKEKKYASILLEKVPAITTLLYTINSKWNDTIYDIETNVVTGKGYIIEKLAEFILRFLQNLFFKPIQNRLKIYIML